MLNKTNDNILRLFATRVGSPVSLIRRAETFIVYNQLLPKLLLHSPEKGMIEDEEVVCIEAVLRKKSEGMFRGDF
ncbi:hypothetical protein TNCV_1722531 [Trichonephila clavipes]|nr:hypothetical protein TNCV_1722531 [Trichonephila clavipes]